MLRSAQELAHIVRGAPQDFGSDPAARRYDVIFLKAPLSAAEVVQKAPVKPGVDEVHAGQGVLYYSRLTRLAAQSGLSRIVTLPIYSQMTIRNWNTTTALLALIDESGG